MGLVIGPLDQWDSNTTNCNGQAKIWNPYIYFSARSSPVPRAIVDMDTPFAISQGGSPGRRFPHAPACWDTGNSTP